MSAAPTAQTQKLSCPECGREFDRPQSLGIHRKQKHGIEGTSKQTIQRRATQARRQQQPVAAAIVDPAHAELVAPIEAHANRLRAHLSNLDAERDGILAELRQLDAAVRALSTTSTKPGPKPSAKHVAAYSRKRVATVEQSDVVAKYLDAHAADFADGFTGTTLMQAMSANGGIPFGQERVRGCLDLLHERGIIRLDKIVVGGGKLYKLVEKEG